MGLSVTFVSGLRRSGKSTLIRSMIDRLWTNEPHYIRLVEIGSGKQRPTGVSAADARVVVASAHWLEYNSTNVFDVLPQALTAIYQRDRYGSVVIEADADPTLRYAYPYDHRVFVMPVPFNRKTVFRDPQCAAMELQHVLDDTSAFASEIFGVHTEPGQEEVDPSEARPDLTETQMRGFLYSPLGDELATRVQLQPAYHGLVESDVIVVNTSVGARGPETASCLRRIEGLLRRLRGVSQHRSELFLCGLRDQNGKVCRKLYQALAPMCGAP